jgi:hypothetical protein
MTQGKQKQKQNAWSCGGGSRTAKDVRIYIINRGIQGMEIKFEESTAYHNGGVVVCHI